MSELFFTIEGSDDKPLLVLGHPLGMNSTVWDALIPSLRQDFRILRWDLPGHGKSPALDHQVTSLAEEALFTPIIAKCDELKVRQFHYLGTSIGGMIGLQLLSHHEDRLLSATLTNTGARIGHELAWSTRQSDVKKQGLESMAVGLVSRWFSEASLQNDKTLATYWQEQLANVDDHSYGLLCAWLGKTDLSKQLTPSNVPIQLICGDKDVATTPELMQDLASRLGIDSVILYSNIGHVPAAEAPNQLEQSVIHFISNSLR